MSINDETLMAYADGELSPLEAKRIEAAMANDPTLAARVQRFRAVRRALKTAYDAVAAEPVPEHLRALLGDVAAHEPEAPRAPVNLAAAREQRASRPRFGPPAWAAIAASLVVGLLVGRATLDQNSALFTDDGRFAGAALARVLDTQLAAETANAPTHVGLTFRTQENGLCRTFSHASDDSGVSGLACRENDRWVVRMAVAENAAAGAYRQAGASAPAVLAMVDELIAGEPLDAEQERAAREAGWR